MAEEQRPTRAVAELLRRAKKFFTHDLWLEPAETVESGRRVALDLLRFSAQVADGFRRHRLPMRAAWLSYVSLLALVPLLAVGVSVSKGLLQQKAEEVVPRVLTLLVDTLAPQLREVPGETAAQAQREVVRRFQEFLANVDAGTLGVSGLLILVMVAISLLATVESAFNDIWDVRQGRSWIHRIIYYWAAITLGPLLIFGVLAMTAAANVDELRASLGISAGVYVGLLRIAPFAALWLVFAALYYAMPNTQVRWAPALAGGVVAGTLWQLNNLCAVLYSSRVLTYSKIYGTLGLIPIFLLGLYFSWFLLLLGAEVARSAQRARQQPRFDAHP